MAEHRPHRTTAKAEDDDRAAEIMSARLWKRAAVKRLAIGCVPNMRKAALSCPVSRGVFWSCDVDPVEETSIHNRKANG
jgi:hypothetical protein